MQQQTRAFEFSAEGGAGDGRTLRFDVTEVHNYQHQFARKIHPGVHRCDHSVLVCRAVRLTRLLQVPSAVNFGGDRGEVGHIGNKVRPAGDSPCEMQEKHVTTRL